MLEFRTNSVLVHCICTIIDVANDMLKVYFNLKKALIDVDMLESLCKGHTHNVESKISIESGHNVEFTSNHTLEKNASFSHNVE